MSNNFKAIGKDNGLVRGIFVERVNGIDYEKIIDYGQSNLFTVEEMLDGLNIEYYPEDKIRAFPDPKLGIGSKIEIVRANVVKVNDASQAYVYRTWAENVEQLFDEQDIVIGSDDTVDVKMDEKLYRDMTINITRVSLSEIVEREKINYKTINQDDPTLEKGLTRIKQTPEYGDKKITYMVRRENGIEVSRRLINTQIVKQPVDKIVSIGTKVTILGSGKASWYDWISGNTAAHNTLPMGSEVIVRASNGKSVRVRIIDRGIKTDAIIDLSADAFRQLAPLGTGIINVTLEKP
jgi:uncharacterized protein YabE (DUF348 family)